MPMRTLQQGFAASLRGNFGAAPDLERSLPSGIAVAEALRLLKANSSKWVNDTYFPQRDFAWQAGYGAFNIAQSQIDATVAYIQGQEEHHRQRTFADEYRDFLGRQGIAWDERYSLG